MKKETKKIIEEKIKLLDKLAENKFITVKNIQYFKHLLNKLINQEFEYVSPRIDKYINEKIKNLIKNYNYFNKSKCYVKPNIKLKFNR